MPRNVDSPPAPLQPGTVQPGSGHPGQVQQSIHAAVTDYLKTMDDQPVSDLYDLVVGEVEASMISCVMAHTNNNQSKTAEILGLSRGTLRTKLRKYRLL